MAKRSQDAYNQETGVPETVSLSLKRGRAGGIDVIDVEVQSGPFKGRQARVIPTDSSAAYFHEASLAKPER